MEMAPWNAGRGPTLFSTRFEAFGMNRWKFAPMVFYVSERDIRSAVNSDD